MILLFWLRYYLPYRTIAVIFHLSKSQIHRIIQSSVQDLAQQGETYFDMENAWDEVRLDDWTTTVGIIDSTEVQIQTWQQRAFSGKKKAFTLKYQVVIGIQTGITLNIFGPILGATHDATIYRKSSVSGWLSDHSVTILGDKGYNGCGGVISPFKRKRKTIPLTLEEQSFNVTLAQQRIRVENHFANLKKWKILSHVYRGSLESHQDIFLCCEILLSLQ